MPTPIATYRLQFRNGMTFDTAVELIPYLSRLGISHIYASPIFAAASGSTHGYDVVDPNLIDPLLGGEDGFYRLSDALQAAGLGLILDIVPNHLAASLENPWWYSVVKFGKDSPYAGHFDIDWQQKLTLAVLGDSLERELENGAGAIVADGEAGDHAFDYHGTLYPLHPGTSDEAAIAMQDRDAIAPLLEKQPWRLIRWQEAASGLSYRRFFEISSLVGARVEAEAVFADMHATVLDLVAQGRVDGLRIDHIDGLADPAGYLDRLREAVGPDIYIVVEKILGPDEALPESWPVAGTTGYEFIAALAGVLADHESTVLDEAWAQISPREADPVAGLRRARELMIDNNFRGEVKALEQRLHAISATERTGLAEDMLDKALRETMIAFPVYRTYGTSGGLSAADIRVLEQIFNGLKRSADDALRPALSFLHAVLLSDGFAASRKQAQRFRTRLQHLTGPLVAKSLEDTFFYRYNRLIGLNDVGGDPMDRDGSVETFHKAMQDRARRAGHALTATSTHDTKRGEDARARLYAISEAPDVWVAAVERWRGTNARFVGNPCGQPAPEPDVEWTLLQALAGAWPPGLEPGDEKGLADLAERFIPYVEKLLREAKQRSNWSDIDTDYEDAVKAYAKGLLSPGNKHFLRDFHQTLEPVFRAGVVNSLTQTLLKLTVPGIPDFYQGAEGLDFSLVDPDNRRPVDYAALTRLHSDNRWMASRSVNPLIRLKATLITHCLDLRRQAPDLFTTGDYIPLAARGKRARNVLAFARRSGETCAITIVPRLTLSARQAGGLSPDYWADTIVDVPSPLDGLSLHDVFGARSRQPSGAAILVGEVLNHHLHGAVLSTVVTTDAVVRPRDRAELASG
jgi:(1->4)-alpha-D-glucan 1-alpha-D-glucosylmutase